MYHANLNVNLIVENVTQIKIWIIIVNVSASIKVKKKTVYAKDHAWNPGTSSCKKGKYVGTISDD